MNPDESFEEAVNRVITSATLELVALARDRKSSRFAFELREVLEALVSNAQVIERDRTRRMIGLGLLKGPTDDPE